MDIDMGVNVIIFFFFLFSPQWEKGTKSMENLVPGIEFHKICDIHMVTIMTVVCYNGYDYDRDSLLESKSC